MKRLAPGSGVDFTPAIAFSFAEWYKDRRRVRRASCRSGRRSRDARTIGFETDDFIALLRCRLFA
jgi:hypothetical protein